MGQTIFQKLSLYEVLTMVAIGALCMPLLSVLFSFGIDLTSLYFWIISYCLGLVLHRTIEFFRNLWSYKNTDTCPNFFLTIFHRNNPQAIKDCQYKADHDNKDYYLQYYHVKNSSHSSSISSLEAQEAFLRDVTLVEILYLLSAIAVKKIFLLKFFFSVLKNPVYCLMQGKQADVAILNIIKGIIENDKSDVCLLISTTTLAICVLTMLLGLTFLARYTTQRKIYELVQEVDSITNAIDNYENYETSQNNSTDKATLLKSDRKSINIRIKSNSIFTIKNINKKNKHRRGR